jgi:hypothetical protein
MTNTTNTAPAKPSIGITKGVTLTLMRTPGLTRQSKYPWDDMTDVGDGFAVPEGINLKGFRTLAQKAGAARGKVFSVGKNLADGAKYYCVLKGFRTVDATAAAEADALEHGADADADGDGVESNEPAAAEANY